MKWNIFAWFAERRRQVQVRQQARRAEITALREQGLTWFDIAQVFAARGEVMTGMDVRRQVEDPATLPAGPGMEFSLPFFSGRKKRPMMVVHERSSTRQLEERYGPEEVATIEAMARTTLIFREEAASSTAPGGH